MTDTDAQADASIHAPRQRRRLIAQNVSASEMERQTESGKIDSDVVFNATSLSFETTADIAASERTLLTALGHRHRRRCRRRRHKARLLTYDAAAAAAMKPVLHQRKEQLALNVVAASMLKLVKPLNFPLHSFSAITSNSPRLGRASPGWSVGRPATHSSLIFS